MPHRDWTIRLEDMIEAAEKVIRYTQQISSLREFCSNEFVVDAVIHNVQIIGEAARHIPDEVQARYPAWRQLDRHAWHAKYPRPSVWKRAAGRRLERCSARHSRGIAAPPRDA